MQVSVETLKGLERKVTVTVPTKKVEEEVSQRLRDLARKVKIDGFRPGKVPMAIVTQRFSDSVRQEVARDMVQSTLLEALKKNELVPAGAPFVEPGQIEVGKDFEYSAMFEIYPDIQIEGLNQASVDIIHASVKEADVDAMLNKLREQNKDWKEVSRAVAMGDKVIMDFDGYLEDKPFDGGKAEGYELEIGSDSMIPGFEAGLVGAIKDKPFDLNVSFPKDYNHKDLAGKDVLFKVTIKKVMEGMLPELNDEFASKFNIKKGGVDALKQDIKQNMERELERGVSAMNREKIFDKLLEKNKFDLPKALIDQEIEHLKHEMYHRIFGNEHHEHEKIPDFPRSMFEENATRRVHLGLLFSEYVKKHQITVDKERVDAMINKFAEAYEKPEELHAWYRGNKERLAEIEALVMEEMVSEHILKEGKVVKKTLSYEEAMNPKQDDKKQGA